MPHPRPILNSVALLTAVVGTLLIGFGVSPVPAQESALPRFAAIHVHLDCGQDTLAAYQLELVVPDGVSIVGIEGGEPAAFVAPPYYDPAALQEKRVVLGAFDTGDDLPTGSFRVATVHVAVTGVENPEYRVELQAAASRDGRTISAVPSVKQALR